MAKNFIFYFSGLERDYKNTEQFFQKGKRIKGGMMSFLTFRGGGSYAEVPAWLVRFRKQYGGTVMIDSGAHAFIYAESIEAGITKNKGWQPVHKEVDEILKDPDKYVHEYMDWLEANRESYDWAVEMDIQKIVGNEKVDEWREEFIRRKIPIVIALHPRAGDTIETLRKWKAKGVTYFARGEFDAENVKDLQMLREMSAEGVKIHIFAFSPTTLSKYIEWIDSSDSSSWLAAEKLGQLITAYGRTYKTWTIKSSPIIVKRALDFLGDILDKVAITERVMIKRKYLPLSWYNMFEIQKWVDAFTAKPAYQIALETPGAAPVPAWAGEKDRLGRGKEIYLRSRFNAMKSGMYATALQKSALECNNCIVKDVCPVFEKDALCFFIPHWRKAGAKTRNREQIVRVMENVVAEKFTRYERAKYMEARLGGTTDTAVSNFENDLMKNLEMLHRVKFGFAGNGVQLALNVGKDGTQLGMNIGTDQLLAQVRAEYGDRLAEKITKKVAPIDVEATVVEEPVES